MNDRMPGEISVTEKAVKLGVKKQAVSKMLAKFEGQGLITCRKAGREKVFKEQAYDALLTSSSDPHKAVQAVNLPPSSEASPAGADLLSGSTTGGGSSPPPRNDPDSVQEANRTLTHLKVRQAQRADEEAEVRHLERLGQLTVTAEVARAVFAAFLPLRQLMLDRAVELARRLEGLDERARVREIQEFFRPHLDALADQFEEEAAAADVAEQETDEAPHACGIASEQPGPGASGGAARGGAGATPAPAA